MLVLTHRAMQVRSFMGARGERRQPSICAGGRQVSRDFRFDTGMRLLKCVLGAAQLRRNNDADACAATCCVLLWLPSRTATDAACRHTLLCPPRGTSQTSGCFPMSWSQRESSAKTNSLPRANLLPSNSRCGRHSAPLFLHANVCFCPVRATDSV